MPGGNVTGLLESKQLQRVQTPNPESPERPRTIRYPTEKTEGPLEDLVIEKNLSKDPGEYTHKVPQAIAAQHLVKEGGTVHAGQRVNYILTHDWAGVPEKLALP